MPPQFKKALADEGLRYFESCSSGPTIFDSLHYIPPLRHTSSFWFLLMLKREQGSLALGVMYQPNCVQAWDVSVTVMYAPHIQTAPGISTSAPTTWGFPFHTAAVDPRYGLGGSVSACYPVPLPIRAIWERLSWGQSGIGGQDPSDFFNFLSFLPVSLAIFLSPFTSIEHYLVLDFVLTDLMQ